MACQASGIYEIKAITNRRKLPGRDVEYYVQWKGWTSPDSEEDTWEPIENIKGSGDAALKKFLDGKKTKKK